MKNRIRTFVKLLIGSVLGLAVVAVVLIVWFSRSPTTQLVDASGNELTAGAASDGEGGPISGSLLEQAEELITNKDFAAAKEKLLRVIEESDRDGEACILLCDVSRELKEVEAAVDYGLKAVTLLPENAAAHLAYAEALGAKIFSDMQSFGGMFSAMGQLGLFKEELKRVIELNPDDTEARAMLVFTNMAPRPMGNIERAIELSGEIEARDPVLGRQLLAACYQRMKETERAIELLLASIEEYPEENSFHVSLANIYAEEKRFDDADTEYEAARRTAKDESYYRSLYGQARMRVQNEYEPERAIQLLDEFIAAEPEGDNIQSVAHACWRKGNALEQLGRTQDARAAYEESLRREPGLKMAEKALEDLKE
jgi:tetratricopeptide (TPR) repeat protein